MVTLRYLGHSAVMIWDERHRLIIDPFLTGNPLAPLKAADVNVEYILVTHGHHDHLGDAVPIAKRTGATIIASNEIAKYCAAQGAKVHGMNLGGAWTFPFGTVKLTIAHHTGSIENDQWQPVAPAEANGFLLTLEHQLRIYHAGDTALTYDMKLLGEMFDIDLALLPIGDNYTMGIDDAVKAVEFLNPDLVVPIHHGTFETVTVDPHVFATKVFQMGKSAKVMKPGEELIVEDKVNNSSKAIRSIPV